MNKLNMHELAKANLELADADIFTILKWARDKFGDRIAMTTAFGYSGLVLLHHAVQVMPDLKVYFIDTGFHFPETLQFCKKLKKEWKLNLEVIKPDLSKKDLCAKLGSQPYLVNPDLCCLYCKTEPLLRFLNAADVWLSAIRRDQSITRAGIEVVEITGRGTIKLSPMAGWTKKRTWNYIKKHNLACHPLHDEGYPSIGCKPCTATVAEGGDERDGRWPFMQKLECGIHIK